MSTAIKIILISSLALAIVALVVFSPMATDSNVPANPSQTAKESIAPLATSPQHPADVATRIQSIKTPAKFGIFHNINTEFETDEISSLTDQSFEQLYEVIWHEVETERDDSAIFRKYTRSRTAEHPPEAPGVILAELIRTAPTTDLQVDALRLLAEASQELSASPLSLEASDSDSELHQFIMKFFDEYTVGGFLDAVSEVVENGNQRERLAALSTLEEMHQFAPIWEVAYSVVDDPDPQVRMRALELLTYGDHQLAIEHLLTALNDPNPAISELAEKLLIGLAEAPS